MPDTGGCAITFFISNLLQILKESQKGSLKSLKITYPNLPITPNINPSTYLARLEKFKVIKGIFRYTWKLGDTALSVAQEVVDPTD